MNKGIIYGVHKASEGRLIQPVSDLSHKVESPYPIMMGVISRSQQPDLSASMYGTVTYGTYTSVSGKDDSLRDPSAPLMEYIPERGQKPVIDNTASNVNTNQTADWGNAFLVDGALQMEATVANAGPGVRYLWDLNHGRPNDNTARDFRIVAKVSWDAGCNGTFRVYMRSNLAATAYWYLDFAPLGKSAVTESGNTGGQGFGALTGSQATVIPVNYINTFVMEYRGLQFMCTINGRPALWIAVVNTGTSAVYPKMNLAWNYAGFYMTVNGFSSTFRKMRVHHFEVTRLS